MSTILHIRHKRIAKIGEVFQRGFRKTAHVNIISSFVETKCNHIDWFIRLFRFQVLAS